MLNAKCQIVSKLNARALKQILAPKFVYNINMKYIWGHTWQAVSWLALNVFPTILYLSKITITVLKS